MKLRLLPLLWIVCVPLRSVGVLPQPALDASAPTCAAGAVSPSPPLNAVPVAAAVRSTAANAGPRSLRVIIEDSFLPFLHRVRGWRSPRGAESRGDRIAGAAPDRPRADHRPRWEVAPGRTP